MSASNTAEQAREWVIRCTWETEDPAMVHPQHTYQTKPAQELAVSAAWDVRRGAYKGLRLTEIHLRQCPDGPWVRLPPYDCADCEDTGTTELRDMAGTLLDVSYCSCAVGERRRADEDQAAAGVIESANRDLGTLSYDTLAAVHASLLALDTTRAA